MNLFASMLLVLAAEAAPPPSDGNVPWANYFPWAALTAVVVVLWRTSEAKSDRIIALTERVVAGLENSNAAINGLKDALAKDSK